ncbi:hypothetical protein CUR178_07255 [Leishmania enriettii]|uniref:Uncharacterized protein n=1 Tax=Leishmania enriettii TaxID=5663 RepID=A0A836H2L4_LEIEN|nr:hypothetical protein CUR178_07255 [Leishmania enriettii]
MPAVPQGQNGSPAAPSLPPEPLCVADILPELLPLLAAASRSREGCPFSSLAKRSGGCSALPVPPAAASGHRVQVSIRRRRYEMAMEVALTHCILFFVFFRWPFRLHDEGKGGAAQSPQTVADVMAAAAAAEEVTEERHLLSHYTDVVEPVLRVFLDHWAAPFDTAATAQVDKESTVTPKTEKTGDSARLPLLPPLPRPLRIAYDAPTRVWKFEFAERLTAAEEAAVRARCQCGDSAATASNELCSSPFLLLQNEYMGVLLVFLRRCAEVRKERQAVAAAGASVLAPYPSLPIRWAEMNYDQQLSFVQLIRCFGVVSLARMYARPTAPLATSLCIGADAVARPETKGDICSLPARAAEFADVAEEGKRERCVSEDGFDGLVVSTQGCARCGMAEHSTEECRF